MKTFFTGGKYRPITELSDTHLHNILCRCKRSISTSQQTIEQIAEERARRSAEKSQ
jgi:hypothetical protein